MTEKRLILFVINPVSGNQEIDYPAAIRAYFKKREEKYALLILEKNCCVADLKEQILAQHPDRVIAVGGDGTLRLVSSCLLHTTIPVGIVPAGSANGMAKELRMPEELDAALDVVLNGVIHTIHALEVNGEICIHLSDIGFNAYLVKKFDELPSRGMLTYAKAAWHAFWNHEKMDICFQTDEKEIHSQAAMVVIANGRQYGTGFLINPGGSLTDSHFEIVLIKSYAVLEIVKIWLSRLPWNPRKIEVFNATALRIRSRKKVHFQVDGEYLGQVHEVKAELLPAAIQLISPEALSVEAVSGESGYSGKAE